MQYVPDSVKALLDRYAKISLHVYLDGERVNAGAGACQLAASCGTDKEFSFGNACAASVELILAAPMPGIKGRAVRITWSVDEGEYPLFTGKVQDAVVQAGRTRIEAWDAMYYGGSDAFVPTNAMQQNIDAWAAFSGVAAAMGVAADPDAMELLSGIVISGGLGRLPDDASNSAVAGYIAGLIGGNALIDRSGYLTVRKILQTDFETQPYAGGSNAQDADFYVSGITLQREDVATAVNEDGTSAEESIVYEYTAGDGTLMVNNPLADQSAADRAYTAMEGVVFRPGNYSFPGGMLLEPGDLFEIHSMDGSYTVAAVMLTMSFDGGVRTTAACGGYAPEGGAQGPINQALATLFADYARLRTLVAENAKIVSAKINHLSAEDIVAGRIRSTDFSVEALRLVYPGSNVYPSASLYPNNGEQIIRGFEIDFASGIIRGAFWSDPIEKLQAENAKMKETVANLERRLAKLETGLIYPRSLKEEA